jgi:hypothetical protein
MHFKDQAYLLYLKVLQARSEMLANEGLCSPWEEDMPKHQEVCEAWNKMHQEIELH